MNRRTRVLRRGGLMSMKVRGKFGFGWCAVLLAAGCARSEPATHRAARDWALAETAQVHTTGIAGDTQIRAASDDSVEDSTLSRGELWARWNALRGDAYELDSVERFIEVPRSSVACSERDMQLYKGTTLRYHAPVKISPPFRERLVRFEEVVAEVAEEVYGRTPRRILHLGAFSCRRSRNRAQRLSEHALGNAIDIAGFDFGPLSKAQAGVSELPRRLKGPFQVRVARHWRRAGDESVALHARFLDRLTERLLARRDIFRVAIGPSHRGHHDHFHFDVSPWRYADL